MTDTNEESVLTKIFEDVDKNVPATFKKYVKLSIAGLARQYIPAVLDYNKPKDKAELIMLIHTRIWNQAWNAHDEWIRNLPLVRPPIPAEEVEARTAEMKAYDEYVVKTLRDPILGKNPHANWDRGPSISVN